MEPVKSSLFFVFFMYDLDVNAFVMNCIFPLGQVCLWVISEIVSEVCSFLCVSLIRTSNKN